jgi:hypothetical protein
MLLVEENAVEMLHNYDFNVLFFLGDNLKFFEGK